MNRLYHLIVFFLVLLCIACKTETHINETVSIIPKPLATVMGSGNFTVDSKTTFWAPSEFKIASGFFQQYVEKGTGIKLVKASEQKADILFKLDSSIRAEAYTLTISEEKIIITSSDAAGAFYAVQTLRQLLPPSLENQNAEATTSVKIPAATIQDAPAFSYRGMHLDVSRHFFEKEFIKKYISHLAMLKMNRFHWHLTDDQGWRIEIKQYPRLTTHAAYRDETLIGHYNEHPQQFDGQRYGGFYTQDEVKEIVAYAAQLNVTIIPEIEMPGHAQAAISAYPELGCASGNAEISVATKWGVFDNVFCPNQKTFAFLKNTLTEVIELFPGEYIHIGGDEAPKTNWKNCNHCQQLIQKHNLKDEHGLQSYFIKEIETFVNSKGKKIIGWDEILEGGLAPNATVMSWRGTDGAVTAAKAGHDVILTPTSHAYFDYYQDDHPNEPLAIGGYLPLKKVYSFNPVPPELQGEERTRVLGAQGNIWTEYMPTETQVEYMAFPRILAMAEVVWRGPTENITTEYPEFLTRLEPFLNRLDALDINYANHLYDLEGSIIKNKEGVFYALTAPIKTREIKYSANNSEEILYDQPIKISEDFILNARVYDDGNPMGRRFTDTVSFHKGLQAKIKVNVAPHPSYSEGSIDALINGISGSNTRYGDKEWLGFWGDDLEITIDFNEPIDASNIRMRFYNAPGQWIYAPEEIRVDCYLENGIKSIQGADVILMNERSIVDVAVALTHLNSEKIMKMIIKVPNYGTIPEGQQGAGNKAWTFIDEIVIE